MGVGGMFTIDFQGGEAAVLLLKASKKPCSVLNKHIKSKKIY
jgi:hypothetical protein